jgi:FtsP/CotA-like multicopper oxidase with cupredoxin domain
MQRQEMTDSATFPRDVEGLELARPTPDLDLGDGDLLDLRIAPVRKRMGEDELRMLAYNGSIPGPTLRVRQGSEIVVHVRNDGDLPATVHWHGLRLENKYDGVPHDTQKPIEVGEDFTYRVRFPDAGLYWYHPHLREDYSQDMGLYGNIVVAPVDDYWPPVDRDVVLAVDDLLIEDGRIASYDRSGPDHTAMGRFGNVLFVGGDTNWRFEARRGEVVRFYLTDTANTRVFDLRVAGARMKLVGGDSGRYEAESFVDDVILAPSERAVVDVRFDEVGEFPLEHRTPDRSYTLGVVNVSDDGTEPSAAARVFGDLRHAPEFVIERERFQEDLAREPDEILGLVAEMDMGPAEGEDAIYVCPMHPDVTSPEPGRCPKCGMTLIAQAVVHAEAEPRFACPMDPEVVSVEPDRCPKCGMKLLPIEMVPAALELLASSSPETAPDPAAGQPHADAAHGHAEGSIEWEDTMEEVNRMTNPSNMRWVLVDRRTGKRNSAIEWSFHLGDRAKIRLVNEMDSDHPMHHPFHIHGAGRFLVLTRNGVVEPNLVWKDTVLVRTGEVVDIVLDVSNPGLWMAHCHIAEHAESGMMFSFNVTR